VRGSAQMFLISAFALAMLCVLQCLVPASARTKERSPLIIEALRCQGNVSTSCRFILDYVYLAPGDRVDEDKLQDAKLRLSWLRNFSSVDIRLEKGSARGKVVVVVEVTEANAIVSASGLGITSMNGATSEVFFGGLSDYDLFGSGKTLNFDAEGRVPSNGLTQTDLFARLQYVDPQLFDSQQYFLDADLSYRYAQYTFSNDDFFDERLWAANFEIGRRVGAFGYVAAGYEYRPVAEVTCRINEKLPSISTTQVSITTQDTAHGTPTAALGWNGDDPVFPTGGLQFNAQYARDISGCGNVAAEARYTYAVGPGDYVSLVGQYPWSAGVEYAHDIATAINADEVRRARWYVEPGIWSLGYSSDQVLASGAGVRGGIRLETKSLGTVDLFLYVTAAWRHGGAP
jgi:outer membrane protein assembly factor BamA